MSNEDVEIENAGQIILKMRTKHGMSLRTLADKTGTDYSYLSKMEKGTRKVSLKMLKRIGDVLGYDTKVRVNAKERPAVKKIQS